MISRLLALLTTLLAAAPLLAQELQVIELRFRTAGEVLPILEPLLAPGGVLTGVDDSIFVRTTPQNEAQIREALASIDRAPRQLLITVAQGTVQEQRQYAVKGAARLGGDKLQIGVNAPPGGDAGAALELRAGDRSAGFRNTSSVRALEGYEAYIALGQSAPIRTTVVSPTPQGGVIRETTGYREVGTGFYATARITGDRVILEVSPFQQHTAGGRGQAVHSQTLATEVSGRLGEWIPLGAVNGTENRSQRGILVLGSWDASSEYLAWVKVDEVP